MLRLLFGMIVVLSLCSCAGVSSMSVEQVRALPNANLCYLNSTAPVGFIPLEVARRSNDQEAQLDCKNHEEEILDRLAKQSGPTLFGRVTVPTDMLNRADCKGIELGQTFSSVRSTALEGRVEIISSGYFREVHNNRSSNTFVLFEISDAGSSRTRFIKLPARGKQVVQFGADKTSPRVTYSSCRSF